ncbi:hypothetical protein CERSUDRAFT_113791 [Gelatoporia subvermispora B]|uniref:Exonuclease domain-containing protein n=1 Tax=Ceriporiopsis subvermispora (strain B) TaxID=914234 RepID=M2RIH9_CERS8|nr:hypothetical protein CERSUDRAFT_113791 [Gelatoporia subvermispora B]
MSYEVAEQEYEAFLVFDVESTCIKGGQFDYPNEIIEWPVCLMRRKDRDGTGRAEMLEIVDEFRSFVKPTRNPQLSEFCTNLTGITQEQIDAAPTFTEMLGEFSLWLDRKGLIDSHSGEHRIRFCWCCDGDHDISDFVTKQCFISKIPLPAWIQGRFINVRRMVYGWYAGMLHNASRCRDMREGSNAPQLPYSLPEPLTIPRQLETLQLPPFQGRQHSGIDDARNISRILAELSKRGIDLEPNAVIRARRWPWMGPDGTILKEMLFG